MVGLFPVATCGQCKRGLTYLENRGTRATGTNITVVNVEMHAYSVAQRTKLSTTNVSSSKQPWDLGIPTATSEVDCS